MSAWLSFIGGYAKGANEQIDEQRKKEDQYIQDRMKMAAATRLEKQKEAEKQRQELKEADLSLSINEDYKTAPTAVKMAMLSSPELREIYTTKKKTNPNTTVMDVVNTSPQIEELAKKYTTVADWYGSFQAKPKPVAPETMEAFKNPKRAFGARVGSGEEELRQNAARFGMSPEDALGWESGAQELSPTNLGATVKKSALQPTDIKSRADQVEAKLFTANDLMKQGDPAGKALMAEAIAENAAIREVQQIMKPEGEYEAWSKQRDKLRTKLMAAGSAQERAELTKQLNQMARIERIGEVDKSAADKVPTDAALTRGARGAAVTAVQMHAGNKAAKGELVISTAADGTSVWEYAGNDTRLQAELREIGNKAMRSFYAQFEGNPAARQNVLLSQETTGLRQADRKQLEDQAEARKRTGGAPLAVKPPPTITTPAAKGDMYLTEQVGAAGLPEQPRTSLMGKSAPKKVVSAPINQLPEGAVLIGTSKGKKVYRLPNGNQFVEE